MQNRDGEKNAFSAEGDDLKKWKILQRSIKGLKEIINRKCPRIHICKGGFMDGRPSKGHSARSVLEKKIKKCRSLLSIKGLKERFSRRCFRSHMDGLLPSRSHQWRVEARRKDPIEDVPDVIWMDFYEWASSIGHRWRVETSP